MPRPEGIKITKPSKSEGYDTENETFIKYGKEIKIHDFIQAGKEGTIAKEIIEKAGGISAIKSQIQMQEIDASETVIDMSMDPYTANQILKAGKIAKEKVMKELKIKAEIESLKKQTETKESNE